MKYEYKKETYLQYSDIDSSAHLSLFSALNFVQNMSTEFFANIKSDNLILSTQNNAIWVITRTKMKFFKKLVWKDKIFIKIYSTKISAIRYEVEICFKDENGEIIFIAKQEYCAMDLDLHKVRKISTVNFPIDLEVEPASYFDEYRRLKENFEENEFVFSQRIGSQDIDFSKHTNNVLYVRYLMNTFSCDFLDKYEVNDFEIHYISESREGEELKIYKKNVCDGEYEFLLKERDRECVRAYLKFKHT